MSARRWEQASTALAATLALGARSGKKKDAGGETKAKDAGGEIKAKDAGGDLLSKIKDKDDKVRYEAIMSAGPAGAPAVKPLAQAMGDGEMEVARAAKRALWNVVRHAGRPKAGKESAAVVTELLSALQGNAPVNVKRELMWMTSELAGDEAVEPMAALIKDKDLREDARMVLQRLPGKKSLAALKAALGTAPEDFRPNIAVSLRARGETVTGYPSQKLEPTLQTKAKPLDAAAIEAAQKEGKQAKRKGKKP